MDTNRFKKCLFILLFVIAMIAPLESAYSIEVKRETLENGLVALHLQRHNLPIVKISLLIKTSSLDDPKDLAGLSYMTAQMLLEGTTTMTSKQISEEIEFMGASLESTSNVDYTVVSLSILKKDIEAGFKIFADVLLNPIFSEEELRHNKDVVKGSLKQEEESPGFVANKAFIKAVYADHAYGRLPMGSDETIDKITRNDLIDFHSKHYVPGQSILVCVGDITYEELKELTAKYMGQWQNKPVQTNNSDNVYNTKPNKVININREITQANIVVGAKGIKRSEPDYYAVSVMNYILGGGGFASRLMEEIRDNKGFAYDVHSAFETYKYGGHLEVVVQTKNEYSNTVINDILQEFDRMKKDMISDDELKNAKAYLTGSFPRRIDTMDKIAVFLALSEFYGLGMDYDKKYQQYINAVTKEDILRVAQKYLPSANEYVMVIVGNQKMIKNKKR
ncbi:MAG: insulinase family protein [Candidatus Magnetoovum sp. WYHC-5]|nr:insulinase family protein [Candidatus Magnetoovum sp. WYHC-5]